jgi:hypothetical protein
VSRHHSPNQNKMMLWALCFATRNIISFRHLDYDMDTCAAINIPLEVGSYMYQLKGQHLISEKKSMSLERFEKVDWKQLKLDCITNIIKISNYITTL